MLSSQFGLGQEDSQWLMFKHDSVISKENVLGSFQGYCSFLRIEQDTNRFTLYEYCMIQNKKGKTIYAKYTYKGYYAFTEDSSAINLKPSRVEIFSRMEDKEIKEEKSFSEHLTWSLFLDPYRLILFDSEIESLFDTNSFYFSTVVCQILYDDQMKEYASAYEIWDHGQFEYPAIDSTLLIDTNKYYIELPNLELDKFRQVQLYYFEREIEGLEVLMFDYIDQPDSLLTFKSESKSNHALVHKHYLMLQNEGYSVKFKKE